ncbi:MAG TPA: hypothetical protein VFP84_20365 [Kofleriaceae bacterium]|nr:hypothetical protein [Kofleriaceae bacterium]
MSARSRRPTPTDPAELAVTEVYDPTVPDDRLRHLPPGAPVAAPFDSVRVPRAERSEPVRVISMKEPSAPVRRPAVARQVQIRSLADVHGPKAPESLGHLAPPRDASAARPRPARVPLVGWLVLGAVLAAAIAYAIWRIAGH